MDKLDAPVRLLWRCCCCCCLCRLRIQPCCLLHPTEMKQCFWSRQRSSHKHPASYIISGTVLCKCVFFYLCVCVHLRHIFHLPRRVAADSSLRLASRCFASLTCNNSGPAGIRRGPISTSASFSFFSYVLSPHLSAGRGLRGASLQLWWLCGLLHMHAWIHTCLCLQIQPRIRQYFQPNAADGTMARPKWPQVLLLITWLNRPIACGGAEVQTERHDGEEGRLQWL